MIHSGARAGISELLDGWRTPATELVGPSIAEAGIVVVVSIPERMVGENAVASAAKGLLPLIFRGIEANVQPHGHSLIGGTFDEVDVGGCVEPAIITLLDTAGKWW